MKITSSDDWLNFKPENGLDGGSFVGFNGFKGKKHSDEHIEKLRELGKTRPVTANMRNSFLKRDNRGANNGRALQVGIYDSKDVLRFTCNGNFKSICIDNGLPFNALRYSYANKGKPIFTSISTGNLKDLSMLTFKNWYSIIIN